MDTLHTFHFLQKKGKIWNLYKKIARKKTSFVKFKMESFLALRQFPESEG